jgi:hypothetical protein
VAPILEETKKQVTETKKKVEKNESSGRRMRNLKIERRGTDE